VGRFLRAVFSVVLVDIASCREVVLLGMVGTRAVVGLDLCPILPGVPMDVLVAAALRAADSAPGGRVGMTGLSERGNCG